ncbi:AraC family transcriptional regulator [Undibacterium amnicola]|uniref:AraC family transcriptional regulator n=1 Tax=Undibacterium amnicola TaxID=1834038 RepID=A0ABR6XSM3_9BURK|nr:helix-turn-helix domain-containing protein [Undibacterium amnicola]MBC3832373.1 AraC family transcriptional regulator [Undibacterium amnicola]
MTSIISHIQIANAVLCVLMAAQLFSMTAMRPVPKRLLAFNCLLYAHQSLALVVILNATLERSLSGFGLTRPLLAMLLGPALYVYFSCVRRNPSHLKPSDALHFLLGLMTFALLVWIKPLRAFIDVAISTSFVIYFVLIAIQMRAGKQALAHLQTYAEPAHRWLICLMMMAFINIALEIAVNLEMQAGVSLRESNALLIASVAFFLINMTMILAALRRSDWLEWMYQFGQQTLQVTMQATPSTIDAELAKQTFERWQNLVNTEQLHKLEFGITLAQAAKKLQVPARQLSNAINQVYGQSFSVYLNDQRIQEARKLLTERADLSIIDVMQESGFSSKSNFNKEFLRVSGTSPSAFREKHALASQIQNSVAH